MSQTTHSASHLNVERLPADEDHHYEIRNHHGQTLANVNWLNVNGVRTGWSGSGTIVEFGGTVTIELANADEDGSHAAGAYIKSDG